MTGAVCFVSKGPANTADTADTATTVIAANAAHAAILETNLKSQPHCLACISLSAASLSGPNMAFLLSLKQLGVLVASNAVICMLYFIAVSLNNIARLYCID